MQALEILENHVLMIHLRLEDDLVITANASGIEFDAEACTVSCGIRSIAPGAMDWDPETEEREPVETPPFLPTKVQRRVARRVDGGAASEQFGVDPRL